MQNKQSMTKAELSAFHYVEMYNENNAYDNGLYRTDFMRGHGIKQYKNECYYVDGDPYIVAIEVLETPELTALSKLCQCGYHTSCWYNIASYVYQLEDFGCLLSQTPTQQVISDTRKFANEQL